MFPVKCKALLPLDHVVIHSVAVRGRLGPLTVWVSKEEHHPPTWTQQRKSFRMHPRYWDKIYERTHGPSFHHYVELDLRAHPIKLLPGQTRAIYVHSTLPGDEAIVYDNRKDRRTYDDALVSILTGRAHVSTSPFGVNPIWGWGNPWRDQREFVGRLEYGAVYRLWNPQEHLTFGTKFQNVARTLFLCQRRWESPWSRLPDECIFYILNMCRWDWANDSPADMKVVRKKLKARAAAAALMRAQEQQQNVEAHVAMEGVARMPNSTNTEEEGDDSPRSCCIRRSSEEAVDTESDDDMDEEEEDYHSAPEEEASDGGGEESVEELDEDFEDEFEEEDVEEEEEEDDEDWDSDDGHGANGEVFEYQDDDSDDDETQGRPIADRGRAAWLQRFRGIHVLHALAALDDDGVEATHH